MKNKKNQIVFKKNSRNKNKILLGLVLVLFLLIGVLSSLILINQKQDNRQQASFSGGALLNFQKIPHVAKNAIVSVPIYLNTQDIELESLDLKVNVTGEVKNLAVKIGREIPVKKIAEKIEPKSISLSLAGVEPNKGWSTNQNIEIVTITFLKSEDGEVWLSFDPKQTKAKSSASDENVITVGNDIAIKVGDIKPAEVERFPDQKVAMNTEANKNNQINDNLLIGLIIGSFLITALILLYLLKNSLKTSSYYSHTTT